uniref:F-box domain-containing protein n=1 Tax=Daucus carota subsp. sativus TaxID=79200 RepID=A0A165ABS8_DAUCS
MARSKGKKVRYNKEHILSEPPSTDIISELPGHLRETIVGFLPLEDAVRTSILSRKWRYCWTMIPNLIFEDTFVDRIMDKLFEYDDPELKAFKLTQTKRSNVDHVLGSLSNIEKFSVAMEFMQAKYVAKGDFKKYQMKDFEECTMDHLEIVTFSYFEGFRAEMKLVKFLLACSPLLKKMSIHSHEDLEKDVALMMFKEILQYPTASSRVQIQHTTPAEIDV